MSEMIPDTLKGLTSVEVTEKKAQGLQNNFEETVAKTNGEIFRDNIFTLFNFLNLIIAVALFMVGAYSNLFFMAIILLNITIGISQEIHARNLVAKLSIVVKEEVKVFREDRLSSVPTNELVIGDIVQIKAGDQIPSDMSVIIGNIEVNEALLTGESDLIEKEVGDELLSGSFVSSGQCYGKVIHVGEDNYATKIALEAKVHKPIQSELVNSIRKVSKFTSFVIVPLGVILFLEGFLLRQDTLKHSVVSSSAALLGMLPKGLVLLISLSLATAVIKLAKKKILVQDMYAVETLAHVDTLCLDKTGTITEGKMKVQHVHVLHEYYRDQFADIIGSYLQHSTDNNITMQAIRDHFEAKDVYSSGHTLAFSSERKWGAMKLEGIGTVVLGAPERIVKPENLPSQVIKAQTEGYRVLMLGITTENQISEDHLPELQPLAILEIDDPIRENASQTLAYLKEEGVDVRVISGDNPITVSNVARRAGLENYSNYIDLSTKSTEAEVREAADQFTVFGRVSPQQKQVLVHELKALGRVVAMTGDGVNDVLALRESDCSIAMAEGDNATRQIANLVLLESNFTSLPDVLFEGRRVVNNVTKVAGIFFIKTIYSFFLSIICALSALSFPFIPIQITLIDLAIEGYTPFFLSFESDRRKIKGKFLPTALKTALPNAILVLLNISIVHFYSQVSNLSHVDTTTLMYYLLSGVSILAVIKACLPLNPLRLFLALTTTIGFYIAAMLFHKILEIGFLTAETLPVFLILIVLSAAIRILVEWFIMKGKKKTEI